MKFNSLPWYRNIHKEIANIDMPWISKHCQVQKAHIVLQWHWVPEEPTGEIRQIEGKKISQVILFDWHLDTEFSDEFLKRFIIQINRGGGAGQPLKVSASKYQFKIPTLADESSRNLTCNDALVSLRLSLTPVLRRCSVAGNDQLECVVRSTIKSM